MSRNPKYKDINILIADDDELFRDIISSQLHQLGVNHISQADNGLSALTKVQNNDYAIVICDLKMPEMDGIEFLRHIAENEFSGAVSLISGEELPILKTVSDLAIAHNLNLISTLSKPVSIHQLNLMLLEYTHVSKAQDSDSVEFSREDLVLALNNGWVTPYYQPQVSVSDRSVVGVECLCRLINPQTGQIIFPDKFISLAEQEDLIDELTRQVLVKSLSDAKVWQAQGIDINLSINFSMNTLQDVTLVDYLEQLSQEYQIAAQKITIEVTESHLMDSLTAALEVFSRLRIKGFGLSIDDYGTGYTSIEQLQKIPFKELKIDQMFVRKAKTDPTMFALFENNQSLASKLNMTTVAEGVEGIDEWMMIEEHGVDLAQGYFIARPMTAEDFLNWHELWKQRHINAESVIPKSTNPT